MVGTERRGLGTSCWCSEATGLRGVHLSSAIAMRSDDRLSCMVRRWCRYTMPGGEALEITFSNIRHAFVQEAEKELITLVHFSLKNPIMAGKKKTVNVQIYTEVMGDTAAVRPPPPPRFCSSTVGACLFGLCPENFVPANLIFVDR